jgi:hypothetical protein
VTGSWTPRALLTEDTFVEHVGDAAVNHVAVGVAVLITPWNGASRFMAMKVSVALAAGWPRRRIRLRSMADTSSAWTEKNSGARRHPIPTWQGDCGNARRS